MSVETVKNYLMEWGMDSAVREFAESCATVELAAKAAGVSPARIAKTLSFRAKEQPGAEHSRRCILLVTAGDARVEGRKFRECFEVKSKMLTPDEALERTGHAVGGVCPFAVTNPDAAVYLDVSLRRFSTVYPACGSSNAIMEISCDDLFKVAKVKAWVDVCKDWDRE